MKTMLTLLSAFILAAVPARAAEQGFDETKRFIFHAVLEGLYDDGVADEDVAKILLRREKETYFHFIYACPVCNATIWALESYQARPKNFYGLKHEGGTFGAGLPKEVSDELSHAEPARRLAAMNGLLKTWMERRMKRMSLSVKERELLIERLEKKRKEGMEVLESFRKKEHGDSFGVAQAAPAYVDFTECAACNAAVGKPMKLPEKPRK